MSQTKPYRRVIRHVTTGFAAILVFLALIVPDQITRLPPGNSVFTALLRIPVEALVAGALLLLIPERGRLGRARRPLTLGIGVLLGLLTVIKMIDIGFFAVLARRFDPVLDWILFDDAFNFLIDAIGKPATVGLAVGLVLASAGLVTVMTWAVQRLSAVALDHRAGAWRGLGTVGAAWVALAVMGFQFIGGLPVASHAAADLAAHTALALPNDLADRKRFAEEVRVDAYRDRPADQMLTALRDKDVILSFIESYGRDAIEDPAYNSAVLGSLTANRAKLEAAGFASRSGFLSSPTAGGGSWLAHSTFLSGLWIDNEQRYRSLVSSDRLTLTRAFKNTGHRAVGVEPGIIYAWPEGRFYGYDQIYDAYTLGYRGPKFSWSPMPDQYVMSAFQKLEYSRPGRGPLLAEITLTSSHTPWTPVPDTLDWDAIGDGSVYGPMVSGAESTADIWKDESRVRAVYAESIAYSIDSLLGHVEKYADDDLVMVFLGDHQPASVVVGSDATRDVPITIVAKDPKVFDRIASWGWTDGLKPDPAAPVWRMDTFRDRFLAAFGPEGDPQ
ncbi:sulfatase [Actinoplanes sp. NEAU-A12]|uniref:Sulfatase n=1 Tax=Actinoplanes sandaracinus TaxID=3045177 RepID=A0ABT6WNL1_9ACTN|nr:sulfatase [Actinoplanes sandaracinus]MDI6101307.1 sulfatase [Actinoplanes sandaracinus]